MRHLVLSIIFVFVLGIGHAGDGVQFLDGKYDQALSKAVHEDKFVLLDFAASWCIPCKKMDREVFPDSSLGSFVNAKFIPFKVNADYFWGMDIAESYKVKAYPTLVVLDPKGQEIKRILGYHSAEALLEALESVPNIHE